MDELRKQKSDAFFRRIIEGREDISNIHRAKLFLEGTCAQRDPAACISRLISSPNGILALQRSLQLDLTQDFLNHSACALLQYIQAPELEVVCNGDLLKRIICALVDPPMFWGGLVRAAETHVLIPECLHGFAWTLLHLISYQEPSPKPFKEVALSDTIQQALQQAPRSETRNLYQKIRHLVSTAAVPTSQESSGPGGRHDNDFEDFRQIAVLPTPDELESSESPFLRFANEVDETKPEHRLALHLDNQFRLLRENMIREVREDLQVALNSKKSRRRPRMIDNLRLIGAECDGKCRRRWALAFECTDGIPMLPKGDATKRADFLKHHRKVLADESLACLVADGMFVGLSLIWRRESLLAQQPPVLHIHLPDSDVGIRRSLSALRTAKWVQILQLSTATFAYQPILQRLQMVRTLPLIDGILRWKAKDSIPTVNGVYSSKLTKFITALKLNPSMDLQPFLSLPKSTKLDGPQAESLLAGLTQQIAIIQGPPGTGKSFIGALIAKAIWLLTDLKILVLSYTNHALDQFLDDVLNVGIKNESVVRLGSARKASDRTKPLVLSEQRGPQYNLSRYHWDVINSETAKGLQIAQKLGESLRFYNIQSAQKSDILEYLEFSSNFDHFYEAFEVHSSDDGFRLVGDNGKAIDRFYLLDRWANGLDAGVLTATATKNHSQVWSLTKDKRRSMMKRWLNDILDERLNTVISYSRQFEGVLANVNSVFSEKDRRVVTNRRVVGCTTTAAAKYVGCLQSFRPDVILVEEAGEILESHILTAFGPETRQLVLIGDHKQLRPKAHYHLSVEKGLGYDLNRSMFERLVLKEYPHQTLSQQHRMRPEISTLVRTLTYPELNDAQGTTGRQPLRGFRSSVIFVNHSVLENEVANVYDPRDGGATSTKNNQFEADMTLKCVKYLAQQGYGSDQVVILTPYLGQLRLLLDVLSRENDPVLNDMDSYDLIRAGLLPIDAKPRDKPRLRISTIDNYQGEESDVVVASLTRSNAHGDIGFLNSPERLNVLLSRARDGLILIGNAPTFLNARKGQDLWVKFLGLLEQKSNVFDGFPVQCERHPQRQTLLKTPEDFDVLCPEGGCDAPCPAILNCGQHTCPQKCHQLYDHTKMRCECVLTDTCAVGHKLSYRCFMKKPPACSMCEQQKRREERKKQADYVRQQMEDAARLQHEEKIRRLDEEIERLRQDAQQLSVEQQRQTAYDQRFLDLKNARKLAIAKSQANLPPNQTRPVPGDSISHNASIGNSSSTTSSVRSHTPLAQKYSPRSQPSPISSPSELEWARRKDTEGLSNDVLDELMKMTGLEQVKAQFLSVMEKLDTVRRQNASLRDERLGVVLLGNPGTGKTTIARLYARYLASLGVLPGIKFEETTGAKLAYEGVVGSKKLLDGIVQAGGGAFFVDEAYQLTSGNSPGGAAVLDFLLAEIENTTGMVVFIFAGYEKQMETFFMHNPGLDSRMPNKLHFIDYTEQELRLMLQRKVEKKWANKMSIEDGPEGLYMRIVTKRLHRQSGREGFGNARALENVLDRITKAQSSRLTRERRAGNKPDDFFLTKEDMMGPRPSQALANSVAWKKLQEMLGLASVKQSIRGMLDRLEENYKRELKELPLVESSLNRLFLGSPGTGKTTVAQLYGKILAELGVLSTEECVLKKPADFIGSVMGESERNTKAILDATRGKVLVIDEAYMFYSSSGHGTNSTSDPYRAAIVDTLVAEVQSTPGEDRAVLLLGYHEQMETMLRNVNPGLARRFPIDSAFVFDDYDDDELLAIMNLKLEKQGLFASSEAKKTAISVLAKARRRPNFGNAGEVENLLARAKEAFSHRQQSKPASERTGDVYFEPQDFDREHARSQDAILRCKEMFQDIVDCDHTVEKLVKFIRSAQNAQRLGLDPEEFVPFTFIFKGPPGTGKTTIARKIGRIFYDMDFLSSDKVIECSATDLIGEYVGQTGPKVVQKLDEALGQVLFVDEAYRLGEGHYAKEAVDELVDCLTKPRYKGKIVVVLAGYENEINGLLKVNPGLSSRFPEEFVFQNLSPEKCFELFVKRCQLLLPGVEMLLPTGTTDPGVLSILDMFGILIGLPAWGNGRDVETLAKRTIGHFLGRSDLSAKHLHVTATDVLEQLERLKTERFTRASQISVPQTDQSCLSPLPGALEKMLPRQSGPMMLPSTSSSTAAKAHTISNHMAERAEKDFQKSENEDKNLDEEREKAERDSDVSDAIWYQLQLDTQENQRRDLEVQQAIITSKSVHQALIQETKRLEIQSEPQSISKETATDDEARRLREAMRLQAAAKKRQAEQEAARLKSLSEEAERKREQESEVQHKLKTMGVCCAGFRWIRQASGYRCAGGSHYVSNQQLGL